MRNIELTSPCDVTKVECAKFLIALGNAMLAIDNSSPMDFVGPDVTKSRVNTLYVYMRRAEIPEDALARVYEYCSGALFDFWV